MMKTPLSIRREHEELHADLARAEREPGPIGEAAREVARILHPHFLREDEYAIPPLALLPRLAKGIVTPDMADILPLVARLKEEMPLMIQEHRAIIGAVQQLATAAESENDEKYIRLAAELMVHAQMEEEVLYPAAVLVGEYVKAKLHPQPVRV
jgi:hemerythrin HHE cation binding domain-containing protein